MMPLRAMCFDYGGTLDGPGSHWRERFVRLYHDAGLTEPDERISAAFGHATRCGYADRCVRAMDLQQLIEFHVARQLEWLGVRDAALAGHVVNAFVAGSRTALRRSRTLFERLRHRVALGVISNFYGNVDRLLEEAGIAPWLGTIIDSNRVGVSKPDPAIFRLAVEELGCAAADVLYVGDSFEKDVVGAHAAGLRAAWLVGPRERPCPAPELVDVRLRSLEDVESVLA